MLHSVRQWKRFLSRRRHFPMCFNSEQRKMQATRRFLGRKIECLAQNAYAFFVVLHLVRLLNHFRRQKCVVAEVLEPCETQNHGQRHISNTQNRNAPCKMRGRPLPFCNPCGSGVLFSNHIHIICSLFEGCASKNQGRNDIPKEHAGCQPFLADETCPPHPPTRRPASATCAWLGNAELLVAPTLPRLQPPRFASTTPQNG